MSFESDHAIVKLRKQINPMHYLDGKHSVMNNNDLQSAWLAQLV